MSHRLQIVPEIGECVFTKKIEVLAKLKDCKYVKGDLKLANDVKGDGKGINLEKIDGEVDLGNLPKDKAGFLDNAEYKGKPSGGSGGDSKKSGYSGGMSMGLIIGIIAGVVVVVLIVTVIAVYCYLKKKKSGKGKKGKPAKKGKPIASASQASVATTPE